MRGGGAEGNRTPDLLHAMQALSQLSYGPEFLGRPDLWALVLKSDESSKTQSLGTTLVGGTD